MQCLLPRYTFKDFNPNSNSFTDKIYDIVTKLFDEIFVAEVLFPMQSFVLVI